MKRIGESKKIQSFKLPANLLARILMQKHIFSMWAESKDASKSEEFSMKGVSMQKL